MRRDEIALVVGIVVLFLSMAYAILTTVARASDEITATEPWTPPKIQDCDLPLWDRIRYLCPEVADE